MFVLQGNVVIWGSQVLQSMVIGWRITWYAPLRSSMRISANCNATRSQTVSVIILTRRKRQMDNTNVIWITLLMSTTTNTQATSQRTKIICIAELRWGFRFFYFSVLLLTGFRNCEAARALGWVFSSYLFPQCH